MVNIFAVIVVVDKPFLTATTIAINMDLSRIVIHIELVARALLD